MGVASINCILSIFVRDDFSFHLEEYLYLYIYIYIYMHMHTIQCVHMTQVLKQKDVCSSCA